MIVDPDFLDHWRTVMVADLLGDKLAPVYILRLWAHCQDRKCDKFAIPARGLKAQCRFEGDADLFESALIEAGFVERDGESIHVVGWAEKNASLLAAWENGSKGGRPRKSTDKKPTGNPPETHGYPNGIPAVTHGKPIANPDETDKRRVDKKEEEEQPQSPLAPDLHKPAAGTRLPADWTLPDDWKAWAIAKRPDLNPDEVADSFRDYWTAKPGKDGRKADWHATWRNWIRGTKPGHGYTAKTHQNGVGAFV